MFVEQLYTGCLAEAAYYIESNGEAAIVDPLRETEPYVKMAKERGAKIKYILETHFHADFVSGHLDLAKETGAKIVYGPTAKPNFDAYVAKDDEVLALGDVQIKVLHTPGHTMESSTFLLIDEKGKNQGIFSGDTLFIGDVGRPDLAVKTDLSREDLAAHLYDSLQNKILVLEDDVMVYPGHGAGSACGKNLSKETTDTLGNQKKTNYALRPDMTKEEFVKEVTAGLMPPPQYFPKNAVLNKMGYESVHEVMSRGNQALSTEEFNAKMKEEGVIILDTRSPEEFVGKFIPGSFNVGLDGGMYAVWVGTLIENLKAPILVIAPEGREEESILRLARVGYDNTVGYLEGGINAWSPADNEVDAVKSISAEEFASIYKQDKENINVLDVRNPKEFQSERLVTSQNFPLDYINNGFGDLDKNQTYYLHCAGGYRSVIASSIFKANGFKNVINVEGGFRALSEQGIEKTAYICPSEL